MEYSVEFPQDLLNNNKLIKQITITIAMILIEEKGIIVRSSIRLLMKYQKKKIILKHKKK